MRGSSKPRIALVWTQFTPYHGDRCAALAERLQGRAEILAVEVATSSHEYRAFSPSGEIAGARKLTLFPGRDFEQVSSWRRGIALLRALAGCRMVCTGIPYSNLEILFVTALLRLMGSKVVLLCDSKFDDYPRRAGFEFAKRLGLICYSAVIVASSRGREYFRFLGFRRRPVLIGCDTVSIERVRAGAGLLPGQAVLPFASRDFVFVGRFVAKKNLAFLVQSFARYVQLAGAAERRLVLVGSGELEAEIRTLVASLDLGERVVFTGFLEGQELAEMQARALGLMLVSDSEQWGLVVNEALALGVPVIVSEAPGARDVLVRNHVNGFVVEAGSSEGLARAMLALGDDEGNWRRMSAASLALAPLGDVSVFCDAIELLLDPKAEGAGTRMAQQLAMLQN